MANYVKHLSIISILLKSYPEEVFREPWLASEETCGICSQKEVGSAEDYIVSYKSKWNV
jgi:hypothetical protein